MKLTAHSHLNPTRTGLCYNNHQVDLIEACQSGGFRGKLTQLRKKRKPHKSSFSLVKISKRMCQVAYIWRQFHHWRQIQLDILQKRGAVKTHSVSVHQQINTTGWAAINIGIGLQSQKVLKSFPGLAHHRRRRKNMLLWITSCFDKINLIWVSAWS